MLLHYFEDDLIVKMPFFRGKGCSSCHKTGFNGRVAVHEIVEISEEMRDLISNRCSLHEQQRAANRVGFRSLREDLLKKALLGLTTLDEVERVTVPEYLPNWRASRRAVGQAYEKAEALPLRLRIQNSFRTSA